ncbi:MAG: carbon monoxide dehydrogenase subunit G [Anaerolineae bacterium]|nr:carbon monoxide dehydrogenase subunit G [Anaerolineae bacterium]
MVLKDSFVVEAPLEVVWALLQDVNRLSGCVAGVEQVEEVGPDSYSGVLKIKIGPISTAFAGQVTITARTPPEQIIAEISGKDNGSASLVKSTFTGRLSPVETGTRLDYEMDIALRGRLAQFGLTVVQATAKKMTVDFARCLAATLTADEAEANNGARS